MANTHSISLVEASSQYLSITDTASLSITGDITIEFLIKLSSLPSDVGDDMYLVSKTLSAGSNRAYFARLSSDKLTFDYDQTGGGSTASQIQADTAWTSSDVGVWHHVAMVIDVSAAGNSVFYVDGSPIATTAGSTSATSIFDSAAEFQIGNRDGVTSFVDGLMDEVRVWDDIRTASEISDNMCVEISGASANLQGYWRLNNSLLDETSNDNDLTNNNTALFSTDNGFSSAICAAGPANVKSWNGVALADIKSINGLAIGDIKSINGVA